MEGKYSLRSPAVKRLMREARELHKVTELYYAQPLEDNLFEWHFTVRGPPDTEFVGGRYHGRIILPPEYPMKPPSIMLLTPNGRFEVGKKICLSMSAHHPETWQPSWSIRTVLMAIIGFMPSKGAGAIGALDYTPKERSILAKRSMEWKCSACGSCNSNALLDEGSDSSETKEAEKEIEELAGQISFKEDEEKNKKAEEAKQESSPAPDSSPGQATTGYPLPTNAGASNTLNPWLQANNQQAYMAYNPYYYFGYPNTFGQMPPQMMGQNPTANQMPSFSQPPLNAPNNLQADAAPNQAGFPAANQNQAPSDNTGVRHRTQTVQPPQPQDSPAAGTGVIIHPRPSHAGMASLIIVWFLAVSILALVCRRLFIVQ